MAAANAAAAPKERVALLVGNAAYASTAQLKNPGRDVDLLKQAFVAAGFTSVDVLRDGDRKDMIAALRTFEDKARDADVAVLYYSGHGIELGGENYLVPTDAKLESDRDVEDEAVSLARIQNAMQGSQRLRLTILDACRNNPFTVKMERSTRTRSVARGLSRVEPTSSDTLVAFAAKAGTLAADGDGDNSPFAIALARHLFAPSTDIRIALGKVRDEVMAATDRQQEPFVYGSLGGELVALADPGKVDSRPAAPALPDVEVNQEVFAPAQDGDLWQVLVGQKRSQTLVAARSAAAASLDEIKKGRLGIHMQRSEIEPKLAKSNKLTIKSAVSILAIVPGGPAQRAGLKSGDILVKFNNRQTSYDDFAAVSTEAWFGKDITISFIRDRKLASANVPPMDPEIFDQANAIPEDSTLQTKRPVSGLSVEVISVGDNLARNKSKYFVRDLNSKDLMLLDGTNGSIYSIVKGSELGSENVVEYLKFFFQYVRGPFGAMSVLAKQEDFSWTKQPTDDDLKTAATKFRPPYVVRNESGLLVTLDVLFKQSVFRAQMQVDAEGIIKFVDHKVIASSLPIVAYAPFGL